MKEYRRGMCRESSVIESAVRALVHRLKRRKLLQGKNLAVRQGFEPEPRDFLS